MWGNLLEVRGRLLAEEVRQAGAWLGIGLGGGVGQGAIERVVVTCGSRVGSGLGLVLQLSSSPKPGQTSP